MKYAPKKDVPKYARKYGTLNPSKLANLISFEKNRKIGSESVSAWIRRNPDIVREFKERDKILTTEDYFNRKVLATLCVYDREIDITDLDTLNLVKKHLSYLEEGLKVKICKDEKLKVKKHKPKTKS